jgi:ABC-type transporter Mla subunit MlaD
MRRLQLLCLVTLLSALPLPAQRRDTALSDGEVEQLREAAYVPNDRLAVFVKFLDARSKSIQELVAKPRRPGREDDLHDLFEQFNSIADELNDNLDDYGPRHRDIRKQLPKLIEATNRWSSALRTAPDSEAYNLARKLALESVRDVHEEATRLVDDQKTYFAAHPEAVKAEKERENPGSQDHPIDIPR